MRRTLNCLDCKKELAPVNPEVGYVQWDHITIIDSQGNPRKVRTHGRYIQSLCHYCLNPIDGKPILGLEEITLLKEHIKPVIEPPLDRRMRYNLQQLTGRVNYLDNARLTFLEEHDEPGLKSKKSTRL